MCSMQIHYPGISIDIGMFLAGSRVARELIDLPNKMIRYSKVTAGKSSGSTLPIGFLK